MCLIPLTSQFDSIKPCSENERDILQARIGFHEAETFNLMRKELKLQNQKQYSFEPK